jgi:hypothetical protein
MLTTYKATFILSIYTTLLSPLYSTNYFISPVSILLSTYYLIKGLVLGINKKSILLYYFNIYKALNKYKKNITLTLKLIKKKQTPKKKKVVVIKEDKELKKEQKAKAKDKAKAKKEKAAKELLDLLSIKGKYTLALKLFCKFLKIIIL